MSVCVNGGGGGEDESKCMKDRGGVRGGGCKKEYRVKRSRRGCFKRMGCTYVWEEGRWCSWRAPGGEGGGREEGFFSVGGGGGGMRGGDSIPRPSARLQAQLPVLAELMRARVCEHVPRRLEEN